MSELCLGIDLGTSGVRSAVIGPDAAVIAMARGDYGDAPEARRDPECWWSAVTACLSAQMVALRNAGFTPSDIKRIGVDGTSGSLVLTDASFTPVTRALMYDDSGFTTEAAVIAAHAPDPHVARGPGSALARALKLVAEDPDRRAAHLLHQADFIAARLMERGGWTDLNNALKTGVDPATGDWPPWMAGLPLHQHLLPHPLQPGVPIGPVSPRIAVRFGFSSEATVHAGTTDSIAAFLACAPATPGAAVTSLGTTLAIKLCSDRRIDAPEMGLYAHRIGTGWLLGGASNTGGGVLRHFFSVDDMNALSARIDPGQESPLDYYPLLKPGERFPVNDPALKPRISPRPTDDAAFLHGFFEGIARIERRGYQVMAEHGAPWPSEVKTAGGGAANAVWTAIRSRVLGVPITAAPSPEAAVGTARLVQLAGASSDR